MASRRTLLMVAAAMALVAAAALLPTTMSKTFTVGDDAGWDVGVDYVAWAHSKNIKAGDTIVFKPRSPEQDVAFVDEQDFNACVSSDTAQVISTGDPVAAKLVKPGMYFFICDAEGECDSGMKLAVKVH